MHTHQEKKKFAANLRRNPTYCEARLMLSLKSAGVSGYLSNPVVYGFIPDLYFPKHRLVVEVDGSVHELEYVKDNDRHKDEVFKKGGLTVLRFTNKEVVHSLGEVIRKIVAIVGCGTKKKPAWKKGTGRKRWKKPKRVLDPVRRFNPGPNATLYQPPKHEKKKMPVKILKIHHA